MLIRTNTSRAVIVAVIMAAPLECRDEVVLADLRDDRGIETSPLPLLIERLLDTGCSLTTVDMLSRTRSGSWVVRIECRLW